jgi:hypothetical protein
MMMRWPAAVASSLARRHYTITFIFMVPTVYRALAALESPQRRYGARLRRVGPGPGPATGNIVLYVDTYVFLVHT